ncbi:MAG: hypothetical protein GX206_01350 [Clostridiales bacterium]|nr:hypothetical protein [Clostridiales bacterium]
MSSMENKMKADNNNKKEDGRFKKVSKKHDPQAESARAKFSSRKEVDLD